MTHSDPHNGTRNAAKKDDLPVEAIHQSSPNGHGQPDQAISPPQTSLVHVQQCIDELRQTLIHSGLGQPASDLPDRAPSASIQTDGVQSKPAATQANPAAALWEHVPQLEAAIADLTRIDTFLINNAGPLDGNLDQEESRKQALQLQQEVARARHLLQQGAQFWLGWARLLGLDGGYSPTGLAVSIDHREAASRPRVSIEG